MGAFGISSVGIERIFRDDPGSMIPTQAKQASLLSTANPSRKCYLHLQSDWFKIQLHAGENLNNLQENYLHFLTESFHWENFPSNCVISSEIGKKKVSLKGFIRHTLGNCALKSFFGEKLFEVCPSFFPYYIKYEDDSWKIFYHYPRFLANDLHTAKEKAMGGLITYLALREEQRPELAWIFQTMESELGYLGLGAHDRAGVIMMITWA